MWIIRFHKFETKDYNYIKRKFQKLWFSSRKIPEIIFIKASIEHILLKKSWRQIALKFPYSHLAFYNFFQKYKNNTDFHEILFTLAKRRIFLNIKGEKVIYEADLQNSSEIETLTLSALKNILKNI